MRASFITTIIVALAGCGDWINYDPMDFYSAPVKFDDSGAKRHLEAAAATIAPDPGDKSVTLGKIDALVSRITQEHPTVDVIVFGEMILGAYYVSEDRHAYAQRMAETIPGPTTEALQRIAAEHATTLVVGLVETDAFTGKLYNSQVLVRGTGEVVRYRKQALIGKDEQSGMDPGHETVIVTAGQFRAGLAICSDVQSERVTESLVDAGIDVLFASFSTNTGYIANGYHALGPQFGAWIVFANRAGDEAGHHYPGYSFIIDPAGSIRAQAEGDGTYAHLVMGMY